MHVIIPRVIIVFVYIFPSFASILILKPGEGNILVLPDIIQFTFIFIAHTNEELHNHRTKSGLPIMHNFASTK